MFGDKVQQYAALGSALAEITAPQSEPVPKGEQAYRAYCRIYDAGRPFPSPHWNNLPDVIRAAWESAAKEVCNGTNNASGC